jgi:hypothetical protein
VLVGGHQLDNPTVQFMGFMLFGAGFLVGGLEAILTRNIGFARGMGRRDASYGGFGAIAWGIVFVLVGGWMIALGWGMASGTEQALFDHLVRRPGALLLSVSIGLLSFAVAAIVGPLELQEGSRWEVLANLVVNRLLPGLILLVLGLAVLGAGLLEVAAPSTFDDLGGGFLEMLFGLSQ